MNENNGTIITTTPSQEVETSHITSYHQWQQCPYIWGLEDCITIESNTGKLILVNEEYVEERGTTGYYRYVPVLRKDMKIFNQTEESTK